MNRPRSLKSLLGGVLLLSVILSAPLPAQSIDVLWTNSLTAMNAGEWSKAHALLSKAVQQYDKRAPMLFGPKFGWFWYHKGYCELKVKEYEMAIKSFEACYKKYPNGGGGPDKAGDAKNISFNLYHKRSLLKWGEAAQGAEDYQLAIRMYRKFLDERSKRTGEDPYEKGAFYINMAVCYFKLFKIPEGIENLETAIKNKEVFPTPDQGIMAGFQSLVQACIEKTNEQALIDFLDKNRADITLEPFQMCSFGPIFMRLAADALSAEMDRTAFELYALVPSTVAAVGDVEARLASLATLPKPVKDGSKVLNKELLKADLEILKGYKKSGNPPEVTALAAAAFIHEQNANARGAFAAYEQIELFFNKSPKREEYLYNLVRTSSLIGEVLTTERYGSIFLKTFPESDHVESVRNMMLTSLFFEGEYVKCIEVASVMIDKLATPSKQHDICLHVLGGSYYYTGAYDTAQPLLEQHVAEYPESDFKMAALYFVGSNLSRLQYWSKSATLLDSFLAKFPDPRKNIYMPFALYDRANCHYAEDEMEPALEKLNKLESTFPGSEIMDMAFNLKGNVLQSIDNLEESEVYYLKALELAERRQNRLVAGEALNYLVSLIGAEKRGKKVNPRAKEAVPYYDKFWKEYGGDSPYKAQVAVAGMHPMTISGRAEEALERLQGVISELAQIQGAVGLEEAINSYTKAYLNEHSPVELKDHYYKFPGIDADNRAAQALLRIAIIGVYEGKVQTAKKEKNEDDARDARATVKVLFQDLKNDFQPKSLSNYILVRVGDYLREGTSAARQAVPYYEEAISREDQSYRFPALFGLADIYGDSSDRAENDKAIESLKRIYADAPEKKQKEKALYRITTILANKAEWAKVSERAKEYLDREKAYRSFSPEVSFLLAKSYDERAMNEDAIKAYTNVWAAYAGFMQISIPSVRRVLEMTWKRDYPAAPPKKADRQIAYEFGWKFVDSVKLGNAYKMMKPEERNAFEELEALVQRYEDDPGVMKMSEVKKRAREGRG